MDSGDVLDELADNTSDSDASNEEGICDNPVDPVDEGTPDVVDDGADDVTDDVTDPEASETVVDEADPVDESGDVLDELADDGSDSGASDDVTCDNPVDPVDEGTPEVVDDGTVTDSETPDAGDARLPMKRSELTTLSRLRTIRPAIQWLLTRSTSNFPRK